jgi:hypothetical protein
MTMRYLILLGLLTLAGCQTTGADVQQYVLEACALAVPFSEITALIAANPTIGTAEQVATAICKAAATTKFTATRANQHTIVVSGVTIHPKRRF